MLGRARVVKKGWGREVIYANVIEENVAYAGKILELKPDSVMSLHWHPEKHETWYVLDGEVEVVWIDTKDGSRHQQTLKPGDTWTNRPGFPHRLKNVTEVLCRILEASTYDDPNDSRRIDPGDSQARVSVSLPDREQAEG